MENRIKEVVTNEAEMKSLADMVFEVRADGLDMVTRLTDHRGDYVENRYPKSIFYSHLSNPESFNVDLNVERVELFIAHRKKY